jgi:radical SAM superfamily enzyme YgiQ (UPF0313 family)
MRLENLTGLIEFLGISSPAPLEVAKYAMDAFLSPNVFRKRLAEGLCLGLDKIIVAGPLDDRLILVQANTERWIALNFERDKKGSPKKLLGLQKSISKSVSESPISFINLNKEVFQRLVKPTVYLVALHRKDIFPLPRFALGISVLASTLRRSYSGQVVMDDMQLVRSVDEVVESIRSCNPELVGISVTFSQHNLLNDLLTALQLEKESSPQVVIGGSLPVFIMEELFERWPTILICIGPGEQTITDIVSWWRGDMRKEDVAGMACFDGTNIRRNSKVMNNSFVNFTPELDLLEATLNCNGVFTLEASRGCTNACTFCPRTHKGMWYGAEINAFDGVLDDISNVFDKHPTVARKIFMVDEEFIGCTCHGKELSRVISITDRLCTRGFHWEASTRIDQVVNPGKNKDWHCNRIRFWRRLREQGLDRCLFGLESGVDSMLTRFNKHTTGDQNIKALRTLSACGVPIRYTYITFDHLMSFDELVDSFLYMGRQDVLLAARPDLSAERLVEAICDDEFILANSLQQPLFSKIPYMLVTLEVFSGSVYQKNQIGKDLTQGATRSLELGTVNVEFVDPLIGLISDWAQRWIDRNFSFDYTLKSLQKITIGTQRQRLGQIRFLLKQSAYSWLGYVLVASTGNRELLDDIDESIISTMEPLQRDHPLNLDAARNVMISIGNSFFDDLLNKIHPDIEKILSNLDREHRAILQTEHARWSNRTKWELLYVDN